MRSLLILSTMVALFVGCSSSMMFVNKQYNYDSGKAAIAFLPLTRDALIITNRNDVHDDFKGDPRQAEEIIADTSYKYLFKAITDSIKKIEIDKITSTACMTWALDTTRYFQFQKRIGKDSALLSFNVLKKAYLDTLGTKANILVIINRVSIVRTNGTSGTPGVSMGIGLGNGGMAGGGIVGGTPGSTPTFDATVHYIVWDYLKDEPVSCGEFTTKTGILFAATADTWRALFKSIGKRIVSTTPYK